MTLNPIYVALKITFDTLQDPFAKIEFRPRIQELGQDQDYYKRHNAVIREFVMAARSGIRESTEPLTDILINVANGNPDCPVYKKLIQYHQDYIDDIVYQLRDYERYIDRNTYIRHQYNIYTDEFCENRHMFDTLKEDSYTEFYYEIYEIAEKTENIMVRPHDNSSHNNSSSRNILQ